MKKQSLKRRAPPSSAWLSRKRLRGAPVAPCSPRFVRGGSANGRWRTQLAEHTRYDPKTVMAVLDTAIHVLGTNDGGLYKGVDTRLKAGHDVFWLN